MGSTSRRMSAGLDRRQSGPLSSEVRMPPRACPMIALYMQNQHNESGLFPLLFRSFSGRSLRIFFRSIL